MPGLHVGTYDQALMRGGRAMTQIRLSRTIYARIKDDVTNSKARKLIMAAHGQGTPGMRYLNRVEGIPIDEFEAARAKLGRRKSDDRCPLDTISDARFRRLVPSARDSLVILDPSIIISCTPMELRRETS